MVQDGPVPTAPAIRRIHSTSAGLLVAVLIATATLLSGCTQDPFERYCKVVAEKQEPLTETLAPGGPTALLAALPIFEDLREAAPDDIRDDWQVVITSLTGLEAALEGGYEAVILDVMMPPEQPDRRPRSWQCDLSIQRPGSHRPRSLRSPRQGPRLWLCPL